MFSNKFENTDANKFNIANIEAMFTKEKSEFQITSISPEKKNYYNKLADLAAASIYESQGKKPLSNLIDMSFYLTEENKNLKNASRKIRSIVSIKNGQFFSSYQQVCDSTCYDLFDTNSVFLLARKDTPMTGQKKENRDLRFASNEEIVPLPHLQKFLARHPEGSLK